MLSIDSIRRALAERAPNLVDDPDRPRAAVALVLRDLAREPGAASGHPELLFIERARHPDDPWSGHMAFPGGRVDPGDRDARAAAERETLEEVGLPLTNADPLGRLDDLEGRHAGRRLPLVISAYVYHLEQPGVLAPNYEVEQALWVPLATLVDPRHHVEYPVAKSGYPGIRVGSPNQHVVWGLTYRFLEIFLGALGHPLPDRWEKEVRPR